MSTPTTIASEPFPFNAVPSKHVADEAFSSLGWDLVMHTEDEATDGKSLLLRTETCQGGVIAVTLNPFLATRCGYLIVPVERLVPEVADALGKVTRDGYATAAADFQIDVHGDVTFATTIDGTSVPDLLTDGPVAVIGFDCAHIMDASDMDVIERMGLPMPDRAWNVRLEDSKPVPKGHVWTTEEVLYECRLMADQVIRK